MPDHDPVLRTFPENDSDEIDDILDALQQMASRATSPVVRACLESAFEEIAHLTNRDEPWRVAPTNREAA